MQRRTRVFINVIIFVSLIGFVEVWFGWKGVLKPWLDLSVTTIAVAVLLVFLSYFFRTCRLYDYFLNEVSNRFWLCFKLVLQHNFLNNLLPMRSGEISFPVLMSRYFGVPVIRSLPALLWFRLLDLHTIFWLALIPIGALTFGATTALGGTLVWIPLPWLMFRLQDPFIKYLERKPKIKLTKILGEAIESLPTTNRAFWRAWTWTLVNWLVKIAVFTWVLLLFLDISIGAAWVAVIAGDVTSILPVHGIAGAGTYEAGVAAALFPLGLKLEESLPAAVNLHLFILSSSLIGGLLAQCISSETPES